MTEGSGRAQVSLSLVEAVVGLLVVFAATSTFLVGLPDTGAAEADLDVLAADGLSALDATPVTDDASRLMALARTERGFVRQSVDAAEQLDTLYPVGVRYRLETPHGAVGTPPPPTGPIGRAVGQTPGGRVTLRVWIR